MPKRKRKISEGTEEPAKNRRRSELEILKDSITEAMLATRCPTCGVRTADTFQHINGCAPFDPRIRPAYPEAPDALVKIDLQGRLWAEAKLVSEHRKGVCVKVLTRYCGCGNCTSCQIGKAALTNH